MGNIVSTAPSGEGTSKIVNEMQTMSDTSDSGDMEEYQDEQFHDSIEDDISNEEDTRAKAREEEMEEFKKQLSLKREQRKQILTRHRTEKEELEKSLENERKTKIELYDINKQLRELLLKNNIEVPDHIQGNQEKSELSNTISLMKEEFEKFKSNNKKLRKDLSESNSALQSAFSDIADLNAQNTESIKHIHALKEVVTVSKTMINLREQQLSELKNKLSEIEKSLADRETSMLSTDLRQEYERQLQNIRTLRGLYEERARLSEVTRLGLVRELEEQKLLYQTETNKCKNLSAKLEDLEATIDELHEKIENKNNQISTCQDETRGLKAEMSVVNKLFSQVLLGDKTNHDLDKLVHRLEENHGLLTQMAEKENGSEASTALPKLLLELISQVDEREELQNNQISAETDQVSATETSDTAVNTTPEEIVQNLPKVWRVLMELLSHQTVTDVNQTEKVTTCYKSVETKSGPVLVPSVSQTYIRLKDLIIEKLGLIKEVNRMKQLNGHLETHLEEQERKLCNVTAELSKTWHVVGRLRRHHHQLHTHEKILKYELQQKRKMLNELKEELEYCREKLDQAHEKNTQSEKDWRKLRAEFSSRKSKLGSPSLHNSAESGYSDERPSDDSSESNDESEYVAEPLARYKINNKKSFETILDSSTDFNLAAEREDPPSDMLDVADLPLDTQDDSHSENLLKSDKTCDETEDEIGDINNDSYIEDTCSIEQSDQINNCHSQNNNQNNEVDETIGRSKSCNQLAESSNLISPAEILRNVRLQNERLAKRDKKLENLEKNTAALLKKTQNTAKFSEQINSTLDHLISRPTLAHSSNNNDRSGVASTSMDEGGRSDLKPVDPKVNESSTSEDSFIPENYEFVTEPENNSVNEQQDQSEDISQENKDDIESEISITAYPDSENSQITYFDLKPVLENSKQANEGLPRNEVREDVIQRSDDIDSLNGKNNTIPEVEKGTSEAKPSTSNEIDHEARFAARDLRLKRLEEQTKSLVNKVNKTTSKGVKINYKLEELHNIYGSESSRAGTPSEENDDKTQKSEDSQEE